MYLGALCLRVCIIGLLPYYIRVFIRKPGTEVRWRSDLLQEAILNAQSIFAFYACYIFIILISDLNPMNLPLLLLDITIPSMIAVVLLYPKWYGVDREEIFYHGRGLKKDRVVSWKRGEEWLDIFVRRWLFRERLRVPLPKDRELKDMVISSFTEKDTEP